MTETEDREWIEKAFKRLCDEMPHLLKIHKDFSAEYTNGRKATVRAGLVEDLIGNVRHGIIVSQHIGKECAQYPELLRRQLTHANDLGVELSHTWDPRNTHSNQTLVFSNTVYVCAQTIESVAQLSAVLSAAGLKLILRDDAYYAAKEGFSKPDLLLCHDSRDKDAFVRPLAKALQERFLKVWYDEYSLEIGDSLVETIDKGLRECAFAVIVVSPRLLSRKKWTAREFRSLSTREIESERKILLPVWLDVTQQAVAAYSLDLADRVALNAALGVDVIADRIKEAVRRR